jgi:hypothetical protein
MSTVADDRNGQESAPGAVAPALCCAACEQPLYVGQPMVVRGRTRMHVGCSVLSAIRSQYGDEALRQETLPPLLRSRAA